MNWVSKKVVLSQVKKYFIIEHDDQVEVEITGRRRLKCRDLKLRNDVVNDSTLAIHIQQLFIKQMQLSYDTTQEEPLQILLEGITLVLTFNPNPTREPPEHTKTKETLKSFIQAINSKEGLFQKGFMGEEIFQLKKMLSEALVGRLSLIIRQVDVSLQYESQGEKRLVGIELGEINIKQRMVISHGSKSDSKIQEDELLCSLQEVSIYLGISSQERKLETKAKNRQILHKIKTIKKVYLLQRHQIQLFYNMHKNILAIEVKELLFKASKLVIYQLSRIGEYLQKHLSARPLLRPGQGEKKLVTLGYEERYIREGTLKWWDYVLSSVFQKIKQRKKGNFISNTKFQQYLFFLYYKYTFGANKFIDQQIQEYEEKKLAQSTMETYFTVLSRIAMVRDSKKFEEEQDYFIKFLQCNKNIKNIRMQEALKQISYEQIRKSKVFFNLDNCREYIRGASFRNTTNVTVSIQSLKFNLVETKYDVSLIEEGFKLPPQVFYSLKSKYISRFYKSVIEEPSSGDKTVVMIQLSRLQVTKSRIQTKIVLPSMVITDQGNQVIGKVKNLSISKQNKSLFSERDTVIICEKTKFLKATSIFLNFQQATVKHLLTIWLMLNGDVTKAMTEQEEFELYFYSNVYSKLSVHPSLETFTDQSTSLQVEKITVITSLFADSLYLVVEVGGISYSEPINLKPRILVRKMTISRSRIPSASKLKVHMIEKLAIQKQSVLIENNKPLIINMEKMMRRHYQSSQEKQKRAAFTVEQIKNQRTGQTSPRKFTIKEKELSNKKDVGYVYFEPIIQIVVPFLLVQLSFLDLLHFRVLLNYWQEIIDNRYFFPTQRNKTQFDKQFAGLSPQSSEYIQKEDGFTRVSRTRLKLQGLELILYGENKCQPENRILTVLLESLLYEDKQYVLGRDTTISLLNFYIQNCLGNRVFNPRRFRQMMENPGQQGQPLIYLPQMASEQGPCSYLILYGIEQQGRQHQLLKIKIKSQLDIVQLSKHTVTDVSLNPLFIYQSPDFYQIITHCLTTIRRAANRRYRPSCSKASSKDDLESDCQILQSSGINEKKQLNCRLSRLNIIALYQSTPIFTITLLDIEMLHRSELYVTKYHLKTKELYVVDISTNCGLHPMIFKSQVMNCYLTMYQSELLKKKEHKSALLTILLDQPQIHFLNRKIKEVTNFILAHLDSSPLEEEPEDCSKEQGEVVNRAYPFCYKLEMIHPVILLLRGSLSQERFVSEADSILIHNISDSQLHSNNEYNFFAEDKMSDLHDSFESCVEINEKQIKFYGFAKENEENNEKPTTIFITVDNFNAFPESSDRVIMSTPSIIITLVGKDLSALVQTLELNLTAEDFRLLIRLTEENFSETPVSYPKDSHPSDQKNLDFRTKYKVNELLMRLQDNQKEENFGKLTIKSVNGTNTMFSNGEKEDEISVESLEYESCLKQEIVLIITKKEKKHEEGNYLLLNQDIQKVLNSQGFHDYPPFARDHQDDDDKMDLFFQSNDDNAFKFDSFRHNNHQDSSVSHTQKDSETKIEKAGRWLGGMCQKCLCCFSKPRNDKSTVQQEEQLIKNIGLKQYAGHKLQEEVRARPPINNLLFQESVIEDESQIIDFQKKVQVKDYHKKNLHLSEDCIYMHIIGEKSREKRIYMLVQDLNICYEKNQHIMALINFMGKPYAEPEKPDYVKDARFNNYRPFQMLVQLTNSSILIEHKEIATSSSIVLDLNMTYNLEKVGDPNLGPGKKIMSADLLFETFYISQNESRNDKKIPLSNLQRLIWEKESRKRIFQSKGPVSNEERLLMTGLGKQGGDSKGKYNPRTVYQEEEVKFMLPVSSLRQMNVLIQNVFTKKKISKQHQEKYREQPQKELKKRWNKGVNTIKLKKNKIDPVEKELQMRKVQTALELQRDNFDLELESKRQIEEPEEFNIIKLKDSVVDCKARAVEEQKIEQNDKISHESRIQDNLKHRPEKKKEEPSKTIKIYFVPEIVIDIETKLKTSFLKTHLKQVDYKMLQCNKIDMQASSQNVQLEVGIEYLNLNLTRFEPLLEPFSFEVSIEHYGLENSQNNVMRVKSRAEKEENSRDYLKGVSLNLSTSFFHTLKELEIKYQLANEDLEIWSQKCFNLTTRNTRVYHIMLKKDINQSREWPLEEDLFQPHPPNLELKNFFGRHFILQNRTELGKKKSKKMQLVQKKFHIQGLRVFLYHSFFESKTKLKNIIYRTPFRMINMVSDKINLQLSFKVPCSGREPKDYWNIQLEYKEYYCMPADIYDFDFLISIEAFRKGKQPHELRMKEINNFNIRDTSMRDPVKFEAETMMSVRYLLQMHAVIEEYHTLGKNKLNDYLFALNNLQPRLIDKRDILVRSGKNIFTLLSIKTECDESNQKQRDSNLKFYDSLTVVISPIIIYNFTSLSIGITLCRSAKIDILPGRKIEINQFPENILLKDINVEFAEDIVHHEYRFLDWGVGERQTIKGLLIDRMQSLNLRIIKETYNSCVVEIYADWLITNKTELEFQLEYLNKEFPIDRNSSNFLAIHHNRHRNHKAMRIKLYDNANPAQTPHEFATELDLLDIFTLLRTDEHAQSRTLKHKVQELDQGCCSTRSQVDWCCESKRKEEHPFRCIEIVLSIQQSSLHELTKELVVNYKYLVINNMADELIFCQSVGTEANKDLEFQEAELFRLGPNQMHYLYSFDFLPKIYFVSIERKGKRLTSNYFTCDASTTGSLSLRLKGGTGVQYVRVDINQVDHTNELNFRLIDEREVKHPFYIKNKTQYSVKITQNEESFKVKPKDSNPFLWSNLVHNTHEIRVEIEGVSKEYSLKQRSEFQPLIIRGDNLEHHLSKRDKRMLFKREVCRVKWQGMSGQFLVIYDMISKKLHLKGEEKALSFDISTIESLKEQDNKIQVIFNNSKPSLEFYPSVSTLREWSQILSRDIDDDMIDKVYFTIESFQSSMIFFLHNVDISEDNNLQLQRKEYFFENIYISIINNSGLKVEEILLINMQDIQFTDEQRITGIKERDLNQNFKVNKSEQCFRIKKLKINNQLMEAVNPVILSQIKKSKYPFFELTKQKQNLIQDSNNEIAPDQIDHYKTNVFFLDEAELMVEAALFPKILNLKGYIQQINHNYRMENSPQNLQPLPQKKPKPKRIYINFLEIKPIKMTISVNFESTEADSTSALMNFLTIIPAGVENAIITIDSYMFHHVFLEEELIKKTLKEYYLSEMKKQIVYNAGSIQFFAPLQLIQGLGIGVKNIFYNPFYELVSTQEVQSFASTFLEGFITFLLYIFTKCFLFLSIIVKTIAFLSFDRTFQSKREMFRRQIFKSPIDGFNYGGRQVIRIFKQFFINFTTWPCEYHAEFPCIGIFFGLLLAILNIFPWFIKLLVTLFDFVYVIGLGLINWGYYQENSMKERSRPIRTFPFRELHVYDYLTAKGNEIMRKNQIQQNDSETISFIYYIDEGDDSKYLVLSNYRVLYCTYQLLSFKEVQLYKIAHVSVAHNSPESSSSQDFMVRIDLSFPDHKKYICFESNIQNYQIRFRSLLKLKEFLHKLRVNMENQNLNFSIDQSQLQEYEHQNMSVIHT